MSSSRISVATLFLLLLGGQAFAQVTIDSLPVPVPGDRATRYLDIAPLDVDLSATGEDLSWHWTLSDTGAFEVSIDTNDLPDSFPLVNLVQVSPGFRTYLDATPNAYAIMGLVGNDPLGQGLLVTSYYEPALNEIYAPLSYLDSLFQASTVYTGIPLSVVPDSVFQELPIRPDTMRVRVALAYKDKVDAWGELTINEQSSEVLRLKRTTTIAIGVEAQISILPWVDVTDLLLSLADILPEGVELLDTNLSYLFVAPGEVNPIAEAFVNLTTGDVQSIEFGTRTTTNVAVLSSTTPVLNIYPNPSTGEITVRHSVDTREIRVFDALGRQMARQQVLPKSSTQLSLLHDGLHILQSYGAEGQVTGVGKVLITR